MSKAKLFLGLMIIMLAISSCGPAATPEQVEVVVEVTKIVEGETIIEEVVVTATPAPEEDPGEVVYIHYGGSIEIAGKAAFFSPFQSETGITLRTDTDPSIARLVAMVESGNVTADVVPAGPVDLAKGLERGDIFQPIDYSYFDPADLASTPDEFITEYAYGALIWSNILAFSTDVFPDGGPQPQNWVEFWDVEKFPGMRALPNCQDIWNALPEAAMLSTGIAVEDVYPIDIDLAVEQVAKIAPYTIFYGSSGVGQQLLNDGEVVMAQLANGRVQMLINQGLPLEIVWNQSRYNTDWYMVLQDAPNRENAMKLVAFFGRARNGAIMAEMTGYPTVNQGIFDYLPPETDLSTFPTHPENLKVSFPQNGQWWVEHADEWVDRCTEAVLDLD